MNQCPNCQNKVAPDVAVCPVCQAQLILQAVEIGATSPYQTPQAVAFTKTDVTEGDATGGLIPYKNPKALIAYYLGILSGLPLIGLPLGIAAFVLGILGLRDRRRNPVIKGSVHAGIGIGCGLIFTILWSILIVVIIAGLVLAP